MGFFDTTEPVAKKDESAVAVAEPAADTSDASVSFLDLSASSETAPVADVRGEDAGLVIFSDESAVAADPLSDEKTAEAAVAETVEPAAETFAFASLSELQASDSAPVAEQPAAPTETETKAEETVAFSFASEPTVSAESPAETSPAVLSMDVAASSSAILDVNTILSKAIEQMVALKVQYDGRQAELLAKIEDVNAQIAELKRQAKEYTQQMRDAAGECERIEKSRSVLEAQKQ